MWAWSCGRIHGTPWRTNMSKAAGAIATGANDIVLAGGVESMTMIPMTGNKLSASPEAMRRCPDVYTPMGITAEIVAKRRGQAKASG